MPNIDWFFRDPGSAPSIPDTFSQLYLLRRDIDTCFGLNPDNGNPINGIDSGTGKPVNCKAIWPGVMGILAGIDLLGKFLAGNDEVGGSGLQGVGGRFRNFLEKYLALSDQDAETIYQLRNSLLHSFGLYSEVYRKGKLRRTYRFILTQQGSGHLIQEIGDDTYEIDVQLLRRLFNSAIAHYQTDLKDTARADYDELQRNFDKMLRKHGSITIR